MRPLNDDAPQGTVLESNEEIRRAQEALRGNRNSATHKQEQTFRPTIRPPVAMLTVYDDGMISGEEIRIRDDQYIVGRTEGDLKLAFDEMLSSRHFAINRHMVNEGWRWVVTDLQSKNGTFFRVSKAPLTHKSEFLVGRGCYKFQIHQQTGPDTQAWIGGKNSSPGTKVLQADVRPGTASISEMVRGGSGVRFNLLKESYAIGSNKNCDVVRADDPFTSPTHALLNRSERGTWMIQNNGTRNGVWLRLTQLGIAFGSTCEFQAGEQRFRLSFGVRK